MKPSSPASHVQQQNQQQQPQPSSQGKDAPSVKKSLCDAVLQLVLDHVRADGYGGETIDLVKRHFATLPSRYALSVDPGRHDDVLLHMRLLNEVRDSIQGQGRGQGQDSGRRSFSLTREAGQESGPAVSVRRVGIAVERESIAETAMDQSSPDVAALNIGVREGDHGRLPGASASARADTSGAGCSGLGLPRRPSAMRVGMPIQHPHARPARKRTESSTDIPTSLPRPAFGSLHNLSGHIASPSKASRYGNRRSPRSKPGSNGGSSRACSSAPSGKVSILAGHRGSMSSLDEHDGDDELEDKSPGSSTHGGSSNHGGQAESSGGDWEGDVAVELGWEVTVAAPDRPGLLTCFTSAISDADLDLHIREAHIFSSSDGLALQVFVITSPKPHEETEELQLALLQLLRAKWMDQSTSTSTEISQMANLKASVEAMAYEDWAVHYKDLTIGEKLGGGSSGRLYKGSYRGQEVAVKVISLASQGDDGMLSPDPSIGSRGLASAQELLQCFKREVSIMRIIRHKNVLQFIGACSDWPRLFIVTELMSRGSIRDVLDKLGSGLPPSSALKVFRDAAKGMDFLHRRGILHRDLKSANLLIDENDVVKVCDFGVARIIPPSSKLGAEEAPAHSAGDLTAETGTYRWMAPEVLEHKPYGFKADVFSFAITMWEVLSGDVPYVGMTPLQAAVGVVQRNLRPLMPTGVPPPLRSLVERCWDTDPEARPSFSEILSSLEHLMMASSSGSMSPSDSKAGGGLSSLWRRTFGSKK